jgi:hypothetical protein
MGDGEQKPSLTDEYHDSMGMIERAAVRLMEKMQDESGGYSESDPMHLKMTCVAVAERVWSQVYIRHHQPKPVMFGSLHQLFEKPKEG